MDILHALRWVRWCAASFGPADPITKLSRVGKTFPAQSRTVAVGRLRRSRRNQTLLHNTGRTPASADRGQAVPQNSQSVTSLRRRERQLKSLGGRYDRPRLGQILPRMLLVKSQCVEMRAWITCVSALKAACETLTDVAVSGPSCPRRSIKDPNLHPLSSSILLSQLWVK